MKPTSFRGSVDRAMEWAPRLSLRILPQGARRRRRSSPRCTRRTTGRPPRRQAQLRPTTRAAGAPRDLLRDPRRKRRARRRAARLRADRGGLRQLRGVGRRVQGRRRPGARLGDHLLGPVRRPHPRLPDRRPRRRRGMGRAADHPARRLGARLLLHHGSQPRRLLRGLHGQPELEGYRQYYRAPPVRSPRQPRS